MSLDRHDAIILAIIILFMAIAITAMAQKSITNDELAHIPAGISYLKTGDYRMNAEHPPLIKLLAGIAIWPLDPKLPLDHPSWAARKEWVFGDRFFFQANRNPDQILFWARMPIVLIGALLILFVYIWARQLYGPWAGIIAGIFIALDPLITAMSTVVHTDIGITTFGFIATYIFWQFSGKQKWGTLFLCALFLGLALASKFTGFYFILILGVLALIAAHTHESRQQAKESAPGSDMAAGNPCAAKGWGRRSAHRGIAHLWSPHAINLYALTGLITLIALAIFAATYRFTQLNWFIQGMQDVSLHSIMGHNSFFHGAFSSTGFWYYFPAAFLIKTPLPTILLIILAIALSVKELFSKKREKNDRQESWSADEWFLLVPALIYLALFMINRINIGVRHILPVYPFLLAYASKTTRLKSKAMLFVLAGLVAWLAWNAYAIYPDHLSNFNELAGGPDNGYRWLIDSNIDWGQDLKGLAQWLHQRGDPIVLTAYFGHDDRDYRNISWNELKCGPQPGLIAISVNRLVGFDENDSTCSAWLRTKEPIAKIGHSIFVYNITDESIKAERESYCADKCREKCASENQFFVGSSYTEKCKCECIQKA